MLQQIAKALRISAETLYVRAGILDEDRRPDLVSEILKDESLSELQKQVLIDHYRSYVESNREPHERAASVQEITGESSGTAVKRSESVDLPTAEES